MTRVTLVTANTPGAVAILQLVGDDVVTVLSKLTGRMTWPDRRAVLCSFADIDEGLAIRTSSTAAQLMPHGGLRVVQKLIERLTQQLGCVYDAAPDTRELYPEATSPIEADMLDAIANAASPAAIDLLAQQPALWAGRFKPARLTPPQRQAILDRSRTLDRLIIAPTVVVVGPPNAGKSTLTNALLGRAVSLVADLPGTTRDWVGALVELDVRCPMSDVRTQESIAPRTTHLAHQSVAVHWLDTPGLRASQDAIEQRAIALARQQIERADVLIAMRAGDQAWPEERSLPRAPDLWVVNKVDLGAASQGDVSGERPETPLHISAKLGVGLDLLQAAVIAKLGLTDTKPDEPWAFSATLRRCCEFGDDTELRRYCQSSEREA